MTHHHSLMAPIFGLALLAPCGSSNQFLAQGEESQGEQVTQNQVNQARELGQVRWGRDHDAVFEASRKDGKPVLLLFQEIPG